MMVPAGEGVTDPDVEMGFIRENMPPATSYYHDNDGFTVIVWATKVGVIETYVFDNGRPTAWYFSAKMASADAWWRKTFTVGENTGVAARWIHKRVKRFERKEESARLVDDFILVWRKCGAVTSIRRNGSVPCLTPGTG